LNPLKNELAHPKTMAFNLGLARELAQAH
jgi:hypothetical protein